MRPLFPVAALLSSVFCKVAVIPRPVFTALVAGAAIGFLTVPTRAETPGFNCRYAKTNVERLICADGSLSQLDSEMNRLFKEIEGETWGRDGETGEPIDPAGDEQRQWRETVRDACANTACLRAAYTDRLAAMRKKWADALRPADQ